jgi:hypothetical protein
LLRKQLVATLTRGRWPIAALIAFSLLIRREALQSGFFADDYAQLAMLDGDYPLRRPAFDLYTFSDGSLAEGEALIRAGFYPWWADPTVRISMFRPLASLMTWLDFQMFGSNALAHHLHSLVWWVALLVAVGLLYRELVAPVSALLAFLLFVLDESLGIPLGWLCNRSAVVTTLLSLLALRWYLRHRTLQSRRALYYAAISYAVALAFGEYALCTLGYFIAFEALRGSGSVIRRLRALAPILGLATTYLLARAIGGFTMQRSGLYVDALGELPAFLTAVLSRLPVFIGDMVFSISSDYWTFGAPFVAKAVDAGWLGQRWLHDLTLWRTAQTGIGLLACMCAALVVWRVSQRDSVRNTMWLLLGAILSLLPVCGSFPSSRLTIVAAFGFMPCIAAIVTSILQRARALDLGSVCGAGAAVGFLAYHLVSATCFARDEALRMRELSHGVREAVLRLDVDPVLFSNQDLIVLAAPEVGSSMYLPLTRKRYGRSAARSTYYLSLAAATYQLTRVAPNAFTMRYSGLSTALETPHEQLLRSPTRPFRVDDIVDAGAFKAKILELYDGRPKVVQIELGRPLDDRELLFMLPTTRGYRRVRLPPIGESITIALPGQRDLSPRTREDGNRK